MKANLLLIGVLGLGCENRASFQYVETQRAVANENAKMNALEFRGKNEEYSKYVVFMRGDSTQTRACPQGDGWASVDLRLVGKNRKIPLKCSTVSPHIGCMLSSDFKQRAVLAKQEGKCSSEFDKVTKIGT